MPGSSATAEQSDSGFSGYRRRLRVIPEAGCVVAALEDDFHHFEITLWHDGTTITDIKANAPRAPWSTCPGALAFIQTRMTGHPLAKAASIDSQRQHCTHLYDLFILAAAHALDSASTQFDITVTDPVDTVRQIVLKQDGQQILTWTLTQAPSEETPDETSGRGDVSELFAWTRTLHEKFKEHGLLMRRAFLVGLGRQWEPPSDGKLTPNMQSGVCFTMQPERSNLAHFNQGTRLDFSNRADELLKQMPTPNTPN